MKKTQRKTKSKKAQIQSQIFVYVLAIIIMGIVLLYGYKSIATMQDKAEQIDILSFKKDIENEVVKMSTDFGSVRMPIIHVPSNSKEVCFVDLDKSPVKINHPLVYEAWEDKSANVFLIDKLVKEVYLIQQQQNFLIFIESPGHLCFPVINNRIQIKLEGIGGKAKLSSP